MACQDSLRSLKINIDQKTCNDVIINDQPCCDVFDMLTYLKRSDFIVLYFVSSTIRYPTLCLVIDQSIRIYRTIRISV